MLYGFSNWSVTCTILTSTEAQLWIHFFMNLPCETSTLCLLPSFPHRDRDTFCLELECIYINRIQDSFLAGSKLRLRLRYIRQLGLYRV